MGLTRDSHCARRVTLPLLFGAPEGSCLALMFGRNLSGLERREVHLCRPAGTSVCPKATFTSEWLPPKGTPRCPACSGSEVSYHSTYLRRLGDLPWQGQQVHLQVKTRRFRCRNRDCPRMIFAERLPGVAAPRARATNRLAPTLRLVGYLLGGLPGSRLLERLGIIASRDTVLRTVKTMSGRKKEGKVRVLGVDDWAWRKQQRYGAFRRADQRPVSPDEQSVEGRRA
jgi:zinc-finger of transposase IS204/IS1001/IS1096/IS1165